MLYFTEFPKTNVLIENKSVTLIDIFARVKLLDYIKNNQDFLIQNDYYIEHEKRPEQISYELYGSYDYTWIILTLNNVYDINTDWVMPQFVLDKRMISKYGSIENANRTVVAWYDRYGYEVSENSKQKVTKETAFQKIMRENELKKNIKVFTTISVKRIQRDFLKLIKDT